MEAFPVDWFQSDTARFSWAGLLSLLSCGYHVSTYQFMCTWLTPHGTLASLGCTHAMTYYVGPGKIIEAAVPHVVLRKYPMLKCEVIAGPSRSCWFMWWISSSWLSELVANCVAWRVCQLVATSYYLIPSAVSFLWWFVSANLKSIILDICRTCLYKSFAQGSFSICLCQTIISELPSDSC